MKKIKKLDDEEKGMNVVKLEKKEKKKNVDQEL